jgi:hypothetical protein
MDSGMRWALVYWQVQIGDGRSAMALRLSVVGKITPKTPKNAVVYAGKAILFIAIN